MATLEQPELDPLPPVPDIALASASESELKVLAAVTATASSSGGAPSTDAAHTDAPRTEALRTVAPRTEALRTTVPHTAASRTAAPRADTTRTAALSPEAPRAAPGSAHEASRGQQQPGITPAIATIGVRTDQDPEGKRPNLTVLGAGSYGTALAMAVATKGTPVLLWSHRPAQAHELAQARMNAQYLPGILFPPSLSVTSDLKAALAFSKDLLLVVPSSAFVASLQELKQYLTPSHRLVWATKGFESHTGALLSEVVEQELDPLNIPLAALSGPTFARELAQGLPTAIACAGTDQKFVDDVCKLLHTPTFRVYQSHDLLALQIGGAVKNVIAIGAGMSDGLGYGANARTALISRGLAEMIRLGIALGASERGFMGLSGLGDLMLTCTDNQSRNRRLGFMLGQGKNIEEALAQIGQVVEGYHMVHVVDKLAQSKGVEMPICHELYEVIVNHKNGAQAARDLLSRALTSE